MELTTDYYAYEYAILCRLNDVFNIKNVEFYKETREVYTGLQASPVLRK